MADKEKELTLTPEEDVNVTEAQEDVVETSEEPVKQTPAKKAKLKKTQTDIMNEAREREEIRQERATEREESNIKWHLIQNAYHSKSIVKGTIISIEETANNIVIAIVNHNGYRVIIPVNEMYEKEFIHDDTITEQQRVRREKQMLVKSLGAEIDFVIIQAEQIKNSAGEKEQVIIGSRKQALERQKRYYFGITNGLRRVNPGQTIRNVPIVAVGKEALRAVVCGVEVTLLKSQLSYKFIASLSNEYRVGDKIDVIVQEIKDKENGGIELTVSHKQTKLDSFKRNVNNCSIGGIYRGTITNVKDYTVQLYLNDINVPAFSKIVKLSNIDDLPSAGDTVLLVARKILTEKGLVLGTIIRLIKK